MASIARNMRFRLSLIRCAEKKFVTQETENILQELEAQLTDSQISAVKYTIADEEDLSDRQAYEQQSALMKINADQAYRATATFYLSSDSREKTSSIVSLYEDLICGTGLDYVVGRTELTGDDVAELVSLMSRTSDDMVQEKDSFTVVVMYYNETGCRELLETITDFIYEKQNELTEIFGAYEITAMEPSLVTVKDISYSDYQKNYRADTLKLQQEIESDKEAFTEEQALYYDILLNGEVTKQKESNEDSGADKNDSTVQFRVDYIVWGALLAAFLYAFWIFLVNIFHTRICASDNLQELYDIPQLGMIPREATDKKRLGRVDKMVLWLRNRNKRSFSREETVELTEAAIKLAAAKESLTTVYLVGCNLQEDAGKICEQLKEGLQKEKIQVNVLNNILYDARSMKEIERVGGVVLVEKTGSTLYNEISQEIELLKRQGVQILGGVIVD